MTRSPIKAQPVIDAEQPSVSTGKATSGAARVTKRSRLIDLLNQKGGTDIATISSRLGWQSHTTRAALSGLRKAGYEITSRKADEDRETRYQISAGPAGGRELMAMKEDIITCRVEQAGNHSYLIAESSAAKQTVCRRYRHA